MRRFCLVKGLVMLADDLCWALDDVRYISRNKRWDTRARTLFYIFFPGWSNFAVTLQGFIFFTYMKDSWPLLTVETEVNGDWKSTNKRGRSFLVGSLDLSCRYNRFLSFIGCSLQPSTKCYFLTAHSFTFISPHRSSTWAVGVFGLYFDILYSE